MKINQTKKNCKECKHNKICLLKELEFEAEVLEAWEALNCFESEVKSNDE